MRRCTDSVCGVFGWICRMQGNGNQSRQWLEHEIRVEEWTPERARRHVRPIARRRFAPGKFERQSRAREFLGDVVRAVPDRDSVDDWVPAEICEPGIYNPGRGHG